MKINKISMAIMAATAVLAITPAVHAQAADTNAPAGGSATRPRGGQMLTVEMVDKAVTLTEEEKPKVKTVVDDYNKALTDARASTTDQTERRAKAMAAREDMDKKMKDILTPEQYTKFMAMPRRGGGGGNRNGGGGAAPATPATPPAN